MRNKRKKSPNSAKNRIKSLFGFDQMILSDDPQCDFSLCYHQRRHRHRQQQQHRMSSVFLFIACGRRRMFAASIEKEKKIGKNIKRRRGRKKNVCDKQNYINSMKIVYSWHSTFSLINHLYRIHNFSFSCVPFFCIHIGTEIVLPFGRCFNIFNWSPNDRG